MSVGSRSNWNLEVLVFEERGKPEYPEKNLSGQRREPKTNSTHIWLRRRDLNPGHIGGRRALSPLHHPLLPYCLSLYQSYLLCFSRQKKFCKKGVIVAIGLLNNMKVTWTCCIKTFFLDTRSQASFSLTLMLIGMLYEMKVKSNLVHQINKLHLVRQKIFS